MIARIVFFILCCSLPTVLWGLDVTMYFPTQGHKDIGAYAAQDILTPNTVDVIVDPSMSTAWGTFQVTYKVSWGSTSANYVNTIGLQNGVVKSKSPFFAGGTWAPFGPCLDGSMAWDSAYTFSIVSCVKAETGEQVDCQIEAEPIVCKWVLGSGPRTEHPYVLTIKLGAGDECPPRVGMDMNVTLTIKRTTQKPHTVGFYVDGAQVEEVGTIPVGTPSSVIPMPWGPFGTASGAFNWEVKVDGVTAASGSVGCADEIQSLVAQVTLDDSVEKPAQKPETKDQTPTKKNPDPTGENKSGDSPGTNPNQTTVLPGSGTPTAEMTKQDFYDAVKQGVTDAGNSGSAPGKPFTSGLDDLTAEGDKRGRLDDVQDELDKYKKNNEALKTSLLANLDFSEALSFAPTSSGSINSFELGTFRLNGQTHSFTVSLASYKPLINEWRQLWVFIINCLFVLKCAHTLYDAFIA